MPYSNCITGPLEPALTAALSSQESFSEQLLVAPLTCRAPALLTLSRLGESGTVLQYIISYDFM